MRRKNMKTKVLTVAVAASMVVGLCPATVFAATGSQVAADGDYTKTVKVVNDSDDGDDWDDYNVIVSFSVTDGKLGEITVDAEDEEGQSYCDKVSGNKKKGFNVLLAGKEATEDTVSGWDTVTGATCTYNAVKAAALEAIQEAPAAGTVTVDSAELEKAIQRAEALTESEWTAESWSAVEDKLKAGKSALEAKESQEKVDNAAKELNAAIDALEKAVVEKPEYVLMNIPYAEFYQADVRNDVQVDAFSSATLSKTRTGNLAGGSYHVNKDGSDITGITFPVKVGEGVDLSAYTQITDESSVEITVTNRGQTSTTTYKGKDALFESASYSYYVLSEAPSFYKELSVNNGSLSFGKTVGDVTELTGISAELSTESSYGDYQLGLEGLTDTITTNDQIYGVIISTKEGNDYGLRHLENIWRVSELAWCTGFTKSVHNCPTSSAHYAAMMGQTIDKITYYTSKGIYKIPVDDIYVPVKFESSVSVENAAVTSGKTAVTVEGLPADYDAEYSVKGLADISVADGEMTFKDAEKGKYTLVISDKNGKYADLSADFILYTEEMPAEYNEDSSAPALVKAEDATEEEFADYLKNITSVSVNGKSYAASGRGSVVIVNEDGTLKTDAAPFAEGDTFEITVSSTGYLELSFTYTKASEPVVKVNTSSLENAIAAAEALKEADYTGDSWKVLQAALANAKKALDAKESQDAVDKAADTLNSAIAGLKKNASNPSTNANNTDSTSENKTTNSNSSVNKAVKTGDPSNVMGLLALTLSSLGVGGITMSRRKKSRRDK